MSPAGGPGRGGGRRRGAGGGRGKGRGRGAVAGRGGGGRGQGGRQAAAQRRRSGPLRIARLIDRRLTALAATTAVTAVAWGRLRALLRPAGSRAGGGRAGRGAAGRRGFAPGSGEAAASQVRGFLRGDWSPEQDAAASAAAEHAISLAEVAAAWDIGAADTTNAPRLAWDIPRVGLVAFVSAAARLAERRGMRLLLQQGGSIRRVTVETAPGLARSVKRVAHLRLVLQDAEGRAAENLLVAIWRGGAMDTWFCGSPVVPTPRVSYRAARSDASRGLPLDDAVTEPVDAVFTWVNAADPDWRRLVGQYRELDALDPDRFVSADELKYALRSLDLFAPWFRHIFIFTNCAPPPWFQPTERITWVDHADVIPPDGLPLFNSHAIEAWLHRIPGLAEQFVYFNDDFMLWDSVAPSTFYTRDGRAIAQLAPKSSVPYFFDREVAGINDEWQSAAVNGSKLLRERFGFVPSHLHEHAPYALLRSVMDRIDAEFPEDMARVRAARFRTRTDVSWVSFFFHHYAAAIGKGIDRHVPMAMLRNVNYRNAKIQRSIARATFLCINDGRGSGSDPVYQAFKADFLETHLPVRSSAEKADPPEDRVGGGGARPGGGKRGRHGRPGPSADPATGPIFVVGTPRSGTSLLAAMLNAHSQVSCGPETGLLRNFAGEREEILHDPAWPTRAMRYVTTLSRPGAPGTVISQFGVTHDQVAQALAGTRPGIRPLFEAITVPHMRAEGKVRWAEKTPSHLIHVRDLRRAFPEATIVRIVRDPRAVAASQLAVDFGGSTAAGAAYMWRMDQELADAALEGDPRALTMRFEDLVADPERELRRLCEVAHLPFEPEMVQPGEAGRAVVAPGEEHKARVTGRVEVGRAEAWHTELSPDDQRIVAQVCGEGMTRHGYPGAMAPAGRVAVHPLKRITVRAEEVLDTLAHAGLVADPEGPAVTGQRLVIIGQLGELRFSKEPGSPIAVTARWGRRLLRARLAGEPVLWVPLPLGRSLRDRGVDRAGNLLVRLLARRVSPAELPEQLGR